MTIDNPSPVAPGNDESLADIAANDESHLQKYGYKQELNRALGLFSSFGVQFTSISVGSVVFTTIVVGFGFFDFRMPLFFPLYRQVTVITGRQKQADNLAYRYFASFQQS